MRIFSTLNLRSRGASTLATLSLVALSLGSWSCDSSDPSDDNIKPPGELTILELAQGTPPLVTDSAGFWAVYDDDREIRIDIAPDIEYLKFRVRDFSLLRRPDGTLFGPGDSIFVTVKVIDPKKLMFEFGPAGLRFNPARPAELSLDYDSAGFTVVGDYDADNDSDAEDLALESEFAIWRQEIPGDPFTRLLGFLEIEVDEIKVDILGFTRYALAY